MAFIETIPESAAEGELAALYKRYGNPDGTVDNVLKVHSLNPESLAAHCGLYVQSLHRPSPVSRAEREMIGVVVSLSNGCAYCARHHAAGLARLLPADRRPVAEALLAGKRSELTPREAAMLRYAEQLTTDPASITPDTLDPLRSAGLVDREILDIAQTVAYFAYANRIVLGLGVAIEGDRTIGQWPDP